MITENILVPKYKIDDRVYSIMGLQFGNIGRIKRIMVYPTEVIYFVNFHSGIVEKSEFTIVLADSVKVCKQIFPEGL